MTPTEDAGWSLAIDFGTSNTAAAVLMRGQVRPIQLEANSTTMPSAVIATEAGYRVGQAAENAQQVFPSGFQATPKKLIGEPSTLLGGRDVSPVDLIAEILRSVRGKALAVAGGSEPQRIWVTHPAAWSARQTDALRRAAERAGFDPDSIRLAPEPLAALRNYATPAGVSPGSRVAVFDFGGGTCDVAILERTDDDTPGSEYRLVGIDGDELLGGNDFDSRLYDWVLEQLTARGDDALLAALLAPSGVGARLTLRRAVRSAKEDLSSYPSSQIPVSAGGHETALAITRDEYESLVRNETDRAGELLRRLLEATGTTHLATLYLTGGSSRTPAIARALERITGLTPATLSDPKLVVAEGALLLPPFFEPAAALRGAEVPALVADPAAAPPGPLAADGTNGAGADVPVGAFPPPSGPPVDGVPPVAGPPPTSGTPTPPAPATDAVPSGIWGPPTGLPVTAPEWSTAAGNPQPGQRPKRPWYKGPLLALPIVGALLLFAIPVIAFALLLPGISTAGGNGGERTPSATPTITPTPTATPVTQLVACWDGSEVPEGDACPELAGDAAVQWAFPVHEEVPATCEVRAATGASLDVTVCTWDDMPATEVWLTRYPSVSIAQDAYREYMETHYSGSWTEVEMSLSDTEEVIGIQLEGTDFIPDGEESMSTVKSYDSIPFAAEVYTVIDEADDIDSHYAALARVFAQRGSTIEDVLRTQP